MNGECIARLVKLGISESDAYALRRIAMTLHRWHELECGDGNNYASWAIERDEATDKPYLVTYPHDGKARRSPVADREKGAHKRLTKLMAAYPHLTPYIQGDPRGASLYILRPEDMIAGASIHSFYSRGVAVYR